MVDKTPQRQGPRQRPVVGVALQLLSVLGAVVLLAILFYPADWSTGLTGWWSIAATVLCIGGLTALVAGLGHALERGERHLTPTGAAVMQKDRRAPVLYLRPFEADSLVTAEERTLARIMAAEIGPLVAIGKPEDKLPPLGAARFYEREFAGYDGNWQLFVRDMLLRSRLAVVVPGKTFGLSWELTQCREVLSPGQVIVLVRGPPAIYDAFRHVAALAGVTLPRLEASNFAWHGETDFVGVVAFDANWTAHFSPFPAGAASGGNDEDPRERRLRQGLDSILSRLRTPQVQA